MALERRRGRFGLFGARFAISDDEVRLTEPWFAKLPAPMMLVGLIVGGIGVDSALDWSRGPSPVAIVVASIGGTIFLFGAISLFALTGSRELPVVVSREGVTWGGKHYPVADIQYVCETDRLQTVSSHGFTNGRLMYELTIALKSGAELSMELGDPWMSNRRARGLIMELRDQVGRVLDVTALTST
jgi:hypothetical protein